MESGKMIKLFLISLCVGCMASIASAQNPYRIADPQALSANGEGWTVNPRVGGLQLTVPVSVVPGEIPIPVMLRINGQFSSQRTQFYLKDPDTFRWVEDYSASILRPIYGTQHFGYIGQAANYNGVDDSSTYVLESGVQFAAEDLVTFSAWVADMSPVPTTFTLPQSFGLTSQAAPAVQVTGDGQFATYDTPQSGLGSWATMIGALTQSGYTRTMPGTYRVVMDMDRARVLQYFSEFQAWVPVFWVDRYNHWVAFQWARKTTSMPAGVSSIHTVEAKNQRGKGVRLEWAQFSQPFPTLDQDLLRADMINLDAPSILVRGLPGWSQQRPVGCNQSLADSEAYVVPSVPGPIGRPRIIQVGPAAQVPVPSWQGSAPYVIVYPPSSNPAPILQWSMTYDSAGAVITSFTEPNGTVTSFARYGTNVFTPVSGNWSSGRKEGWNSWSVLEAVSTDVGGRILRRDWSRSTSPNNEPVVVAREVYGDWAQVQRKLELTFAGPSEAPHFGNGALKQVRLLDAAGNTEWAKTVYTLVNAGLGRGYSNASGRVEDRLGEQRRTYAMQFGTNNLNRTNLTTFVGASNLKIQEESTIYEIKKDQLDIKRPVTKRVYRFNPDGTLLQPALKLGVDYDATGRVVRSYQVGDSLGNMGRSYSYDSEGRVSGERPYHSLLPSSLERIITYDSQNGQLAHLWISSHPIGSDTVYPLMDYGLGNFDAFGRAQTFWDERGVATSLAYDVRGRLLSSQRQGEGIVTYGYPDELTTSRTQEGHTTTEKRDGFGRITSISTPTGVTQTFGYDAHGRMNWRRRQSPQSLAPVDSVVFDPLDRPTSHTSETGTTESWAYSTWGTYNLRKRTLDAMGVNAIYSEYRDGFGQVVQVVSPTGTSTLTSFDGQGHVVQISQAPVSGMPVQTRSFSFDALGRLTSRTEPETGITTFSDFTDLGQPTKITEDKGVDGVNRTQTLTWDPLGRLTRQSSATGEYTSWTYTDSRVLSQETKNADGSIISQAFEFQGGAGKQLSKETTSTGGWSASIAYGYDEATGQLSSMTYPSGRVVHYTYDALGRVNQITANGQSMVSNATFNEWGQRHRLTFGSGAYSEWSTKTGGSQLDQWTIGYAVGGLTDPGSPRRFTYDNAQRLTQAGEWSLVHDKEDRILAATASGLGLATDFEHDAFGNNIKSISTGAASAQVNNFTFAAQVGNQIPTLTSAGQATGWLYNARGEATRLSRKADGGFQGITWDGLGRLNSVNENGATTTTTYGPSGLRVALNVGADATQSRRYIYSSGGHLLSEYQQGTGDLNSLTWKRDIVYLGNEAVAELDAAGIHELHNDHLGSPRVITNGATGTIEGRQAYSAYGERILAEGYQPLTGYTGHVQNDPTGLIYMRGRYYSPAWHSFLNSDQGVDPNNLNQRAYVGGSPFLAVDPSGLVTAQVTCGDGSVHQKDFSPGTDVETMRRWALEICGGGGATVPVTDGSGGPEAVPPFDPGPGSPDPIAPTGGGARGNSPQSPQKPDCAGLRAKAAEIQSRASQLEKQYQSDTSFTIVMAVGFGFSVDKNELSTYLQNPVALRDLIKSIAGKTKPTGFETVFGGAFRVMNGLFWGGEVSKKFNSQAVGLAKEYADVKQQFQANGCR